LRTLSLSNSSSNDSRRSGNTTGEASNTVTARRASVPAARAARSPAWKIRLRHAQPLRHLLLRQTFPLSRLS